VYVLRQNCRAAGWWRENEEKSVLSLNAGEDVLVCNGFHGLSSTVTDEQLISSSPALVIKACQVKKFSKYRVVPIFAVALVITSLTAK
jgi:hypothetical protein